MSIKKSAQKTSSKGKTKRQSSSFSTFTPKINLLLFAFFVLVTVLTVVFVQQRQDVRQKAASVPEGSIKSSGYNVPSPVCGGSNQGSVCPSEVPSQAAQPNPSQPGQIEPDPGGNENQQPGQPGQIEPGQPEDNNNGGEGNNGGGNTGRNQGVLQQILQMLQQIMQMLQQLLGGGGGTPTPGNPNPGNPGNPQPSTNPGDPGNPGNPQPSTNPGDPGNPGNPQPSAAPSTAPSTAPSGSGDTVAPSAPSNLKVTSAAGGKMNLTWTASTDNAGGSGIKEYEVYRSEGDASTGGNSGINFKQKVGTATKFTDTGRKAGVRYYYYIRAYDNAGNRSEHSNTAGATGKK